MFLQGVGFVLLFCNFNLVFFVLFTDQKIYLAVIFVEANNYQVKADTRVCDIHFHAGPDSKSEDDLNTIVAITVSLVIGTGALCFIVYFLCKIHAEGKKSTYSRIMQMNVY